MYKNIESRDVSPLPYAKHESIKKVYVEIVRQIVESAAKNALDAKIAWIEATSEDGIEIYEPVLCVSSCPK